DDCIGKPYQPAALAATLGRWIPRVGPPAIFAPSITPSGPADEETTLVDVGAVTVLDEASLTHLRPDFLAVLLELVAREAPRQLAAMRAAAEQADAAGLAEMAHHLKGEASILGGRELEELCVRLERLGSAATVQGAGALLQDADDAYRRLLLALA